MALNTWEIAIPLDVPASNREVLMLQIAASFVDTESTDVSWERRSPHPEDDHLLAHTQNWLNAMPRGVRPVHLQDEFPRIANDLSRLWDETAALDHYFEDLDFSPRTYRAGFAPLIKEELLAMHLFSLRSRAGPYEASTPKTAALLLRPATVAGSPQGA